ncbi:unnamed protein product, partial [Polarella glacialis]
RCILLGACFASPVTAGLGQLSTLQSAFSVQKSRPQPSSGPTTCNLTLAQEVRDSVQLRSRYLKGASASQLKKLGALYSELQGQELAQKGREFPSGAGGNFSLMLTDLESLEAGITARNNEIEELLKLTEAATQRKRSEAQRLREASATRCGDTACTC